MTNCLNILWTETRWNIHGQPKKSNRQCLVWENWFRKSKQVWLQAMLHKNRGQKLKAGMSVWPPSILILKLLVYSSHFKILRQEWQNLLVLDCWKDTWPAIIARLISFCICLISKHRDRSNISIFQNDETIVRILTLVMSKNVRPSNVCPPLLMSWTV